MWVYREWIASFFVLIQTSGKCATMTVVADYHHTESPSLQVHKFRSVDHSRVWRVSPVHPAVIQPTVHSQLGVISGNLWWPTIEVLDLVGQKVRWDRINAKEKEIMRSKIRLSRNPASIGIFYCCFRSLRLADDQSDELKLHLLSCFSLWKRSSDKSG